MIDLLDHFKTMTDAELAAIAERRLYPVIKSGLIVADFPGDKSRSKAMIAMDRKQELVARNNRTLAAREEVKLRKKAKRERERAEKKAIKKL